MDRVVTRERTSVSESGSMRSNLSSSDDELCFACNRKAGPVSQVVVLNRSAGTERVAWSAGLCFVEI